jgi:predicted transcriptional regulator
MPRPQASHPTELELEILKVLWQQQPLSGQEVRDALAPGRDLTYSSVMSMLGIMEEKGYVRRRKAGGRFVYSPRVTQAATGRRMLRDLVDRVFDGSALDVMVNLLETSRVDPDELRELRELIQKKTEQK